MAGRRLRYGRNQVEDKIREEDHTGRKMFSAVMILLGSVLFGCLILAVIGGVSAGYGVWQGIIESAPSISKLDATPTGYYSTVYASDGTTEIATLVASGSNRKYVTIDQVPLDLQHAFVAVEDSRFYEHNGIDLYGIARAFVTGLASGSFNQGASTITQQLIKNNVLTSWTSETSFIEKLQRKIQEQYLAVKLEKQVTKSWILENYMNSINLGANTLGVQAASQKYFGKDVSELTLSECAVIAGITQNPSAYNPITHPEANEKRRDKVLSDMLEQGYITDEEYQTALDDPVYERIGEGHSTVTDGSVNSYFVDALIDDVYDDLVEAGYSETDASRLLYTGGLTIYSTQDLDIQEIVDEEVNNTDNYDLSTLYSLNFSFQVRDAEGTLHTYTNQTMHTYYKSTTGNPEYSINYSSEDAAMEALHAYEAAVTGEDGEFVEDSEQVEVTLEPECAVTIINQKNGEVLAISGGRGEKEGSRTFNRATDMTRQPGSTFKVLAAFAPALESADMSLASVEDDAPLTIGKKTFRNYDGVYDGYTTIRQAITKSINIVTLKTLQDIGVGLGYDTILKFGFTTIEESDKNLSLALGGITNGVTNLELTGAYAAIANGGKYREPKFYTQVLDHDGNVILDRTETQETHRVVSKKTAWLLTNAMQDVLTKGTGKLAYFEGDIAEAGKSGTTTSNRDALFAGFTPYYTCVVWGGFDDNSIQTSTTYPKKIWKAVMSRLHENKKAKDFTMPDGIVQVEVCKKSGLLATSLCSGDPEGSQVEYEYFDEDKVPETYCDHHTSAVVCSESGELATDYCPAEDKVSQVFVVGGGGKDASYQKPEACCTIHTAEWKAEEEKKKQEETGDDAAETEGTSSGETPSGEAQQ